MLSFTELKGVIFIANIINLAKKTRQRKQMK
ncbi:MAG: hypothetical protein ACJAXH_001645 [Colwellia sp.]